MVEPPGIFPAAGTSDNLRWSDMAPGHRLWNRYHRFLVLVGFMAGTAVTPAAAQRLRPLVGAMIGYSSAGFTGSDAVKTTQVDGAATGPFVDIPLGDVVSLRPELFFNVKGGAVPDTAGGAGELQVELGYFELPVLLAVQPRVTRSGLRLLFLAGGGVAYRIGCSLEGTLPGVTGRSSCDDLQSISRFDFILTGGGGLQLRRRDILVSLEFRFTQGMRTVVAGTDLRNRNIGVLLGFSM